MASLGKSGFDFNKVDDSDVIPAGEYAVRIVESDIVPTKAGTGKILVLTMEVMEGTQKGRRHWERLNIVNPNDTAQSIAHKQLKRICEAAGVPSPLLDSEDLHHKPFMATLAIREDDYGKKNDLKKAAPYRTTGGRPATQQQETGGASAPAAKSAGGMPWD
jgi:hypothetical protein